MEQSELIELKELVQDLIEDDSDKYNDDNGWVSRVGGALGSVYPKKAEALRGSYGSFLAFVNAEMYSSDTEDGVERRYDGTEGPFTFAEFNEFYDSTDEARTRWDGASKAPVGSAGEDPALDQQMPMLEVSARPQTTLEEVLNRQSSVRQAEANAPVLSEHQEALMTSLYFGNDTSNVPRHISRATVASKARRHLLCESGLLGSLSMVDSADSVYMNTSEPFCVVTMGIQGGGKSHTVCTILENCLLSFPVPSADPLVVLKEPMSGLVLHYDQSETNVCEATGTCRLNPELEAILSYRDSVYSESIGTLSQMVILVSPTFYHQRKKFYGTADNKYKVLPLLFRWAALNAVQLKKLMRINESDNQLYVGVMLAKLREYQRAGGVPEFRTFCQEIMEACCSQGQSGPLEQRLQVLRQFVAEAEENDQLRAEQKDLDELVAGGTLVVADMTDPMLPPTEAKYVALHCCAAWYVLKCSALRWCLLHSTVVLHYIGELYWCAELHWVGLAAAFSRFCSSSFD